MKNLFIILLLVPITLFGQVKKVVPQEQSYDEVNLNLLNNQFKREQTGRGFQLLGLGMMSYGFLSNYALSKKGINNEDLNSSEVNNRLEKSQNNQLISGLGALISCIGVVIPMNFTSNNHFYNIDVATNSLYAKDGEITYRKLIAVFKSGDQIKVKTMNGEIYEARISNIVDKKLYLNDENGKSFFFYYYFISSIEHQSKN